MAKAKIDKSRIGQYLQIALKAVVDAGGSLPSKDAMSAVEGKLNLSEHEKSTYEKSGYVRWQSVLHFYSIDLTKAGWLRKHAGVWYATGEGRQALIDYSDPKAFLEEASRKYKQWADERVVEDSDDLGSQLPEDSSNARKRQAAFEQSEADARTEIVSYINQLDPYEFQDLAGALLRGMGFHTPFIAPKGKDGGIDIIAYKDPLGTEPPRLKVQVKHREQQKVGAKEVRELTALLHEGDVGIFISVAGFSIDADSEIRHSQKHIEKIDLDRFIDLWTKYHNSMQEPDQVMMPMRSISFLAPTLD